jgi:phosphate uptake regulator
MDERKLIKTGNFSLTVALPKDWIKRHKLDKGNSVFVTEQEDGLLISPKKTKFKTYNKQLEINADETPLNGITRDIVAGYLTNVQAIKIYGKNLRKIIRECKKRIFQLSGLEIIEETSDSLLIKDLINLDEIIIPDILHRIDIILRSMFEDAKQCIRNKDHELAEAIIERDEEVNRLVFLIYKVINYINEHPDQGKAHGLNPTYATHIWELNGYFEKIGDEIKRFARLIPETKFEKKDLVNISTLLEETESFFTNCMGTMYKNKIKENDEFSSNRMKILKKANNILPKTKKFEQKTMINKLKIIISFTNSISRISRYLHFEKHLISKGNILPKYL